MEKVREFSIDPYIDNGGILGAHLAVNETASEVVMQRNAMRASVYVDRQDSERMSYNATGSDELTLSKAGAVGSSFEAHQKSPLSAVRLTPNRSWVINIYDQEVHNKVDARMKKRFRKGEGHDGQRMYADEFLKRLNSEIKSGVSHASTSEKNKRFLESIANSALNDVFLSIGFAGSYAGGRLAFDSLQNFPSMSGVDIYELTASVAVTIMGLSFMYAPIKVALQEMKMEETELNFWEHFIPNPQVKSIVQGKAALYRHGNKLVKYEE